MRFQKLLMLPRRASGSGRSMSVLRRATTRLKKWFRLSFGRSLQGVITPTVFLVFESQARSGPNFLPAYSNADIQESPSSEKARRAAGTRTPPSQLTRVKG